MGNIQCNALSWQPQKEKEPILKKLTLEFLESGFYAVIGPNGSGKTSLLRHIMRFLNVERGSLKIDDKDIVDYKRADLAKKTAFVPQNTFLDTDFSAYDIVMMGRNPYQKRFESLSKEDIHKVEEAMRLASCDKLRDKRMRSLSGGEAQRVVVARAIAQDTPWLLLDEPIASLDIKHQIMLMETLKYLNEEKGTSIIMIMHDINLAAAYCGQVIMMKDGEVLYAGEKTDIFTVDKLEKVYEISFVFMEHPVTGQRVFTPVM